jgi:D-alanyl-D-alanine endopeptidase (penicillin-binding protein 7)
MGGRREGPAAGLARLELAQAFIKTYYFQIQAARGGLLLNRTRKLLCPIPVNPKSGWKFALPAIALTLGTWAAQAHGRPAAPHAAPAGKLAAASAAGGEVDMLAKLASLPVNAKHMLVLDELSGRVLMQKNAEAVVPIASLTKLMTAMVLLDAKANMNEPIRISREDVDRLKHSASHVPVGSSMSRLAAMKLALMSSDNRAAAALARTFPGGMGAFELAMQAKIKTLGLTHTAIAEPTGLSPLNTSTAMEMAKIAGAAGRYPEIGQITSDKKAMVAINGRPVEYRNTNRLVGQKGWDIQLSKTGYTEEAGRCLTMRMNSGGKKVTMVLLDADGSAERLRDAAKIRKSLDKLHG